MCKQKTEVGIVVKNGVIYFRGIEDVDPNRGIPLHDDEEYVIEQNQIGEYILNIKPLHYGGWAKYK